MRLTLPEPLGSAHVLPLLQLEIEFAAFGSSRAIHVSGHSSGHVVALAKQNDQIVNSLQFVPVTLLANNLDEHARVMTTHCVVQSPARTGIALTGQGAASVDFCPMLPPTHLRGLFPIRGRARYDRGWPQGGRTWLPIRTLARMACVQSTPRF